MNTRDDGGLAFPASRYEELPRGAPFDGTEPTLVHYSGMTLRDYAAIKFLASFLHDKSIWDCRGDEMQGVADRAVEWADAMLKARAK